MLRLAGGRERLLVGIRRRRFAIATACVLGLVVPWLLPQPADAGNKTWKNGNPDFNANGAWNPAGAPGTGDVAVFDVAMSVQPNLSASLTIQELNFSTTASSGYDLTSTNTGIKLTLTNTGTVGTSAINAANTSVTNTIDAPLILGAAANSTQTFTQAAGGTLIVNNVISNTNNVTLAKAGTGTLTLSGANTYSGGTTINAGTLNINNASALGTGTFTIAGGSNAIIDNTTGSAITLSANNAQVWNGNFTFTGTQSLNLGTGAVTLGASRTVTVNGSNLTVGGIISGSGFSLTKAGAGTLILSGANTYSGGTTINAGTLQLSGSGTLGSTSGVLTVNGGTLDLNGTSQGVGNFTGSGGTILNNATGTNVTLTIGNSNGTGGDYSGVIANHTSGTGTVALTKTGTGTITLSGANTYTGATTINAGTLFVNGSLASGSAVTVNNSGSVLGGTGTINGSVSIASSGAILEAGTGSTGQTLTMKGAVTMGSGSILELALGASGAHSTLAMGIGGSISFQSLQQFNIIDLGVTDGSTYNGLITGIGADPGTESGWTISNQSWAYNFSYDAANGGEIDLSVTAAPEPSTWIAGALALAALTYNQRRRIRSIFQPLITRI